MPFVRQQSRRLFRELAGVEEASVNFSANTLQVVYDPDKISLKDMQGCGKCRRI